MKKLWKLEKKFIEKSIKLMPQKKNGIWYHKADKCYICQKPFSNEHFKTKKVVDHDHVTSKILGAAHSICNFKRQSPYHTTIFLP